MPRDGYVYVVNWDQFQHGHKRAYPWIKLYPDLLGNDAWLDLSSDDRVLLVTIWMLCGRYGSGRVVADQKWLCRQAEIGWSPRSRNLERLIHAGFLEVHASKALAHGYPSASTELEEEGERDKDPPTPQKREPPKPPALNGHRTSKRLREVARAAYTADLERFDPDIARRQLETDYPTVAKYVLDTVVESET